MEITELNLISDFEAGVNCLQNPSLISQIFPISTLSLAPQMYSLCTWGALIVAMFAAFSGLIASVRLLIENIRIKLIPAVDSIKLLNDDDFDYDDDVDDDDTCSSVSSDNDEDSEEREGCSDDDDYFVSGGISRQFSWSDFASGKTVVRLWDNLTSGFDCDEEKSNNTVSVCGAPAVVLSAEKANNGGVLLGLYDSRVRRGSPEMTARWPSLRRRTVEAVCSGGSERVYVGALTVGDLRNIKSPFEGRTVFGSGTWWDANAVILSDERSVDYY